MTILYHISLYLYLFAVLLVSPFSQKAALFYKGRIGLMNRIGREMAKLLEESNLCNGGVGQCNICNSGSGAGDEECAIETGDISGVLWVHCASVGEFEQARPVIEGYRERNPADKVVLSFFSPSGYELRKDYALADKVFYLPIDTARNARKFIEAVKPTTAIFIKYEFWRNYLKVLKRKGVPTYLVSGIFREDHHFFRWWGGTFRKVLRAFTHFFVQDENSRRLLSSIGFENATISGDTRFDRVYKIAKESKEIEIDRDFVAAGAVPVIIIGSSWPADENIISECRSKLPPAKLIIAPHEIGERHIEQLSGLFGRERCIRYTQFPGSTKQGAVQNESREQNCDTSDDVSQKGSIVPGSATAQESLLVIDTIGILSSIYKYGLIAYIGGGFGAGIHNILEAAVYGIPVVFGPRCQKFKEARDLLALGGAFSVSNSEEYCAIMERLLSDTSYRVECGAICKKYVKDNLGATDKILEQIQMERT